MKVVFCTPTIIRPYQQFLDAMEASIPSLDEAGYKHYSVFEGGNPYISAARAKMLRSALDAKADCIVFLDHDLSWQPDALVRLIKTEGDVVAGTYRFKEPEERYMGCFEHHDNGVIKVYADGTFNAVGAPAGFLKVTAGAVEKFMYGYPELVYGPPYCPSVDLFNHGAHEGIWWGEDMRFCQRWRALDEQVWVIPDIQIDHHGSDGTAYPGNLKNYLRKQPGGDLA